jgi:hypothetical protein
MARGILTRFITRIYFEDEGANAGDRFSRSCREARRDTLIARRAGDHVYAFDIVMQGPRETVFLRCLVTAAPILLGPLFGDEDVSAHLSDRARLQAMLDTELALAQVEAELGIIPPHAVPAIAKSAHADQFDREAIAAAAAVDGMSRFHSSVI